MRGERRDRGGEDQREGGDDGGDQTIPAVGFFAQSRWSWNGTLVELRAPVVVGGAPVCLEKSLTDETKQSGIERILCDE